MELLYHRPDDCPGPYRVVHKLPVLPESLKDHIEIDNVVADSLLAHQDFLDDIGELTARALLQVHGANADFDMAAVRGMAGQIATSLAVAMLRGQMLETAISTAIERLNAEGQAQLACPE
ncbi:hypothetical protein KBY58_05930 [Cyanobium sp. HWJ4-Hawea]|uniref:hypothetical protein n=1 Tax=unclassified Cyanobium TaxID=2627006 RepID=UPI0020CEED48|nr:MULTISPECIES: hypothetical protein [unclassified Cyanobium]MCP9774875.1 hypothetical protein [Cyanobium sp. WAJ14-Wanaka]MCP9808966.1 hypothetical protein [Cyanobium sp. HWJ4-Hawea]